MGTLKKSLVAILITLGGLPANAYDFSAENAEGKTIYYNITSSNPENLTCEVTYKKIDSNGNYSEYTVDIVIPETVVYADKTYTVTKIGKQAFYKCMNYLNSVTIPETVTEIGDYAFQFCTNIVSVVVPNSVKTIGQYAFNGCANLSTINIPNKLTVINEYSFKDCSRLDNITIPESVKEIKQYSFQNTGLTSIVVPNSVTDLYYGAFEGCTKLVSAKIPDNYPNIPERLFYGCKSLTDFTIPESVTKIYSSAFYGCQSLTSINIPNTVYWIGGYAFGESGLTSITIPYGVKTVGDYLFYSCKSLKEVNLPSTIMVIGGNSFQNCSSLESVTIPDGVTYIGGKAFMNCTSLKSITLPASLETFWVATFYGCTGLRELIDMRTVPQSLHADDYPAWQSFPYATCVLKVPSESVEAYKAASLWKDIFIIMGIDEPMTTYALNIEDMQIGKGGVVKIPVVMKNEDPIESFQCDIILPNTLEFGTENTKYLDFEYGDRADDTHVLESSWLNGVLQRRVVGYSTKNHPYSGTDGILFYIPVKVKDNVEDGTVLSIDLTYATLTKKGTFEEVRVPYHDVKLTVKPSYTPCDVNDDGMFTSADIALTVAYVLGGRPAKTNAKAADANGDGYYSAADISIVVSRVLAGE